MTATIALPQPHSDWLARIRTIGLGLGGRGVMGLGLGRSSVQAGGAALHIEDSFTGADGTNLNGWTPDVANTPGNTWTAVVQSWSIISGRARGTNFATSVMVIECGAADGIITMPMVRAGNTNGIVFRYVDTDNYWRFTHSSGAASLAIIERTGGVETVRKTIIDTSVTVMTGTVTLTGNSIAANWNGNNFSYTSSQHATATKHGIWRQDFQNTGVAEWWKMVS